MKLIPQKYLVFPAWFAWMQLVPFASYVFMWMVLPFGVGNSIKNYQVDNPAAQKAASTLFGLGLTMVILPLTLIIPFLNIIRLLEDAFKDLNIMTKIRRQRLLKFQILY